MSDLSNLLGDVYGGQSGDEAPTRRPATPERDFELIDQGAPDWSSQSRLDQAFDGWIPGEPPAGGEQRAEALAVDAPRVAPPPAPAPPMPAFQAPAPVAPAPRAAMPPVAPVAPAPTAPPAGWTAAPNLAAPPLAEMAVVTPAPVRPWLMGDDDILPAGKKGKRKK